MVEKFEICLAEEILEVILNEDGSYTIFNSESRIGKITPEVQDNGVVWITTDLIAPNYLGQIGELIEKHNL